MSDYEDDEEIMQDIFQEDDDEQNNGVEYHKKNRMGDTRGHQTQDNDDDDDEEEISNMQDEKKNRNTVVGDEEEEFDGEQNSDNGVSNRVDDNTHQKNYDNSDESELEFGEQQLNTQQDETQEYDDEEEDYDNDDQYDPSLFKSKEDKRHLLSLSEIEREQILTERFEERNKMLEHEKIRKQIEEEAKIVVNNNTKGVKRERDPRNLIEKIPTKKNKNYHNEDSEDDEFSEFNGTNQTKHNKKSDHSHDSDKYTSLEVKDDIHDLQSKNNNLIKKKESKKVFNTQIDEHDDTPSDRSDKQLGDSDSEASSGKKNKKMKQSKETKQKDNDEVDDEDDDESFDFDDISEGEDQEDEDGNINQKNKSKGNHKKTSQSHLDSEEANEEQKDLSLADIRKIMIRRKFLEDHYREPYFEDVIQNNFTRVSIGTLEQRTVYRLCQIIGVEEGTKEYQFGSGRTKFKLNLKFGGSVKAFSMAVVSNSDITEHEFRAWLTAMKDKRLEDEIITSKQCEELNAYRRQVISTFEYTDEQITKMTKGVKRSIIRERLNLQQELLSAKESNDSNKIKEIEHELQKLDERERRMKERTASNEQVQAWKKINERAKNKNFQIDLHHGNKRKIERRQGILAENNDPFMRRSSRPAVLWGTQSANDKNQVSEPTIAPKKENALQKLLNEKPPELFPGQSNPFDEKPGQTSLVVVPTPSAYQSKHTISSKLRMTPALFLARIHEFSININDFDIDFQFDENRNEGAQQKSRNGLSMQEYLQRRRAALGQHTKG